MKMYGVLMSVVGDKDVVVAESSTGCTPSDVPPPCAPDRKPKNSSAGFKKADWAVNAAGRSYYGRDMLLPVKWCIVEIDVPGEFLQD
jgi:hypothetical protein